METIILQAYLTCALWSSVDANDTPFDTNYSIDDIETNSIEQAKKDISSFLLSAKGLLTELDYDQIGHDFWLTRNNHGAGFWDRGLNEIGERLTEIANSFGEIHVFVNDKGEVYFE